MSTLYRHALRGYLPDRGLVEAIQWHARTYPDCVRGSSREIGALAAEGERKLIADQRRRWYARQRMAAS